MSRMWMFEKLDDAKPHLDSVVKSVKIEKDGKYLNTWKTPYGASFIETAMGDEFWMYEYDSDLPSIGKYSEGTLNSNDIIKCLQIFKKDPNYLRNKPESIVELEKVTGITASRSATKFGGWHLCQPVWSAFNNPFGLSLGYTSDADHFEIWFKGKEKDPREEQTIDQIIEAMKEYKYI